jgi:hypothetical protein
VLVWLTDPIKIPRLSGLESYTFRGSSFKGFNQLSEIGPIHSQQNFQLFSHEKKYGMLFLFTFMIITIFLFLIIFLFFHITFEQNIWVLGGFYHHSFLDELAIPLGCH